MTPARQDGAASEMAIVDTFTKLIFGEETRFSHAELRIIQALRSTDDNVVLDDHHEMGVYLRALGLDEMISLVTLVRSKMVSGHARLPKRTESGADYSLHPEM